MLFFSFINAQYSQELDRKNVPRILVLKNSLSTEVKLTLIKINYFMRIIFTRDFCSLSSLFENVLSFNPQENRGPESEREEVHNPALYEEKEAHRVVRFIVVVLCVCVCMCGTVFASVDITPKQEKKISRRL